MTDFQQGETAGCDCPADGILELDEHASECAWRLAREAKSMMKIEIELGALWLNDGQTLSERLEEMIAARLADQVDQRARVRLDDLVDDVRHSIVEEEVKSIVTARLSHPVQPTDTFGNPKGEPVTLEELVVERAEKYLEQITGWEPEQPRHLRPSTPLIWTRLDEVVDRAFRGKLKKAVKAAEDAALKRVEKAAGEVIAEAVKRAGATLS